MSALDISSLSVEQKTLAGRVIIQVIADLRHAASKGALVDDRALSLYEGMKLASLKMTELSTEAAQTPSPRLGVQR